MSSSTSNQVLHPTNPVLVKDTNVPRERGQTRVISDGSLLYREPLTDKEVPAVRLDDIRPRLVQEAAKKKSYRFPKKRGYDATNVTAFVKRDYNFGPKRENRPDRLFQIESDGGHGEKPDGYIMDDDRIVLDAFDYGLRNFGNQLPMYVSSELEGNDIEDYLRRNCNISVYDLVARAPNGYHKGQPEKGNKKTGEKGQANEWHDGPPRIGTFSMRATRFRLTTGCLSWGRKDGTVAKNQRILDVIPAQYKDPGVNSTKGWRDLNKAEVKKIRDGASKQPQKGPKEKRAVQAREDQEGHPNFTDGSTDSLFEVGEETRYEDDKIDPRVERDHGASSEYDPEDFGGFMSVPQVHLVQTRSRKARQVASTLERNSVDLEERPSTLSPRQPKKRSRVVREVDSDEDGIARRQKRIRVTADDRDGTRPSRVARSSVLGSQQRDSATQRHTAAGTLRPSNIIGSNASHQGLYPALPIGLASSLQSPATAKTARNACVTPFATWYSPGKSAAVPFVVDARWQAPADEQHHS